MCGSRNGSLGVSRAMGDCNSNYKRNDGLPSTKQKVVAVPDIVRITAAAGDRLLLCYDGLAEALTDLELVEAVNRLSRDFEDGLRTDYK